MNVETKSSRRQAIRGSVLQFLDDPADGANDDACE